jgi:hypothetical protein
MLTREENEMLTRDEGIILLRKLLHEQIEKVRKWG